MNYKSVCSSVPKPTELQITYLKQSVSHSFGQLSHHSPQLIYFMSVQCPQSYGSDWLIKVWDCTSFLK